MASTSSALVLKVTNEVAMTAAWRNNEVDVMDIEKFTVPEFVASTYKSIYNQ